MEPLDDLPLDTVRASPPAVPPRDGRDSRWWIAAAIGLVIVAGVAAFLFLRRPAGEPGAPATEVTIPAVQDKPQTRGPLGPPVEPRELPPLDLTDPLVRELLRALSSRPELATWLATDNLVRTFVASVDNVANGRTPAAQLRRLKPSRPFAAEARGSQFVIDPRSYARYDGIAQTVASLDADGLARAYSTLRPRLQEAYQELGYPGSDFDATMERAIARLLSTPQLGPTVSIQQSPVLYKFSDERIESLSAAQKQLLRMGPNNVRLVQDKLREVGRALGIPADRLPSPSLR